jgi:tetratricopeptide (TPR) repeat protein
LGGKSDEFADALHELMVADIQPDAIDSATLAIATACLLLDYSGKVREGDAVFARLKALLRDAADRVPSAAALFDALGALRAVFAEEDPWIGILRAQRGLAQSTAIGHRRYLFGNQIFMAMNKGFLGAHDEALRLFSELALPDEESGLVSAIRPFSMAWMLVEHGAFAEARGFAAELVAAGRSRGLPLDEARGHWVLGEVLRRAGELDAAEEEIQAAVTSLALVCPLDHPGALASLATLRLAQGRPAEALAVAEDALAKDESMGACSIFFRGAFLRLVHAECLEATGRHDAAAAAIARAKERLFVIAEKIGDPAYRKSFLEEVPENRRTLELAAQWGEDNQGRKP